MTRLLALAAAIGLLSALSARAVPVVTTFEAAGVNAAAITPTRDAFRAAIGGGTVAGANGSFGGLRREINWDGVPDTQADPNLMSANFFNTNSPRGVVFSTPGTGFLVSANAGAATPILFGFPNDFQTFSPQRLFTAVNSNITDVSFFVPGTSIAATTTAFGLIFVDVEVAGLTRLEFFDENNTLFYSRSALVAGNQGLTFLGATVTGGTISRVRITSGLNTLVANSVLGNPNDDIVVMDDFLYAEPGRSVPEPGTVALLGLGLAGLAATRLRRRYSATPDDEPRFGGAFCFVSATAFEVGCCCAITAARLFTPYLLDAQSILRRSDASVRCRSNTPYRICSLTFKTLREAPLAE